MVLTLSWIVAYMEKITIKTPNPKDRLFLKIDLSRDLAADVLFTLLHAVKIHTPVLTQPVRKSEGR